jgi:hypothetical protein
VRVTTSSAGPTSAAVSRIDGSTGCRSADAAGGVRGSVTATGRNGRGGCVAAIAAKRVARNTGSGRSALAAGAASATVAGSTSRGSARSAGCRATGAETAGPVSAVTTAVSAAGGITAGGVAAGGITTGTLAAGSAAAIRVAGVACSALGVSAGVAADRYRRRRVTAGRIAMRRISAVISLVISWAAVGESGVATIAPLR